MLVDLADFQIALDALQTRFDAVVAERDALRAVVAGQVPAQAAQAAVDVDAASAARAALSARIDAIGREVDEPIQQTLVFAR